MKYAVVKSVNTGEWPLIPRRQTWGFGKSNPGETPDFIEQNYDEVVSQTIIGRVGMALSIGEYSRPLPTWLDIWHYTYF